MAICSFIKESKQTAGALAGVICYVSQAQKTMDKTALGTQRQHSDRKALSREREKKIAMGHKADDHEEGQKMM